MTEVPETRSSLIANLRSPENRAAWEEFVRLYRPVIYRMARRRGMQDADAQDLAQTVLARVAASIDRWKKHEPDSRFRHWLRRVAKNAILNALTRAPRDPAHGGSDMQRMPKDQPETSDVEREIELEYMREQYLRAAATVRDDVDADTWRAFELTVIEGVACHHAAATLGKSIGTVYAARSRVMRRLLHEVRSMENVAP